MMSSMLSSNYTTQESFSLWCVLASLINTHLLIHFFKIAKKLSLIDISGLLHVLKAIAY